MYPAMEALRPAVRMFCATSFRKAVLNAAASEYVSGGTRRVLVDPAAEALAMTAIPQKAAPPLGRSMPFLIISASSDRQRVFLRSPTILYYQRSTSQPKHNPRA